ncbi:lysophospholipid acyltransferase family protein [Azospirillum halopraeferens]|uniref:lysophospholipid acyltransferase family protein n=1 Tax=Azospirillum halopraeferens TaxID=34010 RepID=UPI000418C979|nr:lysophospholipid acyltransferase family protein [Azospirillum halopraeferens]
MTTLFRILRLAVVQPLARMAGRLEVHGRHHLPPDGGCIVACNHTGWVDPLWLGLAVGGDRVHFLAKRELFAPAPVGALLRRCHVVPIDRQRPGADSLRACRRLLAEGKVLLLFPGGTRSTGAVAFKRGAATLAAMAGVPIVPARYSGPAGLSAAHLLRRPAVRVVFGPPIAPAPAAGRDDDGRRAVRAVTDRLAAAVDALAEG